MDRAIACYAQDTQTSKQKSWMEPIHRHTKMRLLQRTRDTELTRYKGVSCTGSGDWLNALPSSNVGLEMSDDCFRISTCLRLGATVVTECFCICGATNDKFGNHALACPNMRSRHTRHQTSNKALQEALKSAGVPSTLDPRGILRDDGNRPDGVSLLPWCRGRVVAFTHRLAHSNSRLVTSDRPEVATEAQYRKRGHYSALPEHTILESVAIETLGGIGKSSYDFLRTIGLRMKSLSAEPRSFAFLRKRLTFGIEVESGNRGCIQESICDGS